MKRFFPIIVCALTGVLFSCSPVVTSNIIHTYPPLKSADEVVELKEKEPVPDDAEWMGSVQVNGNGGYSVMEALTRKEAWKNGARYFKIKDFASSGLRSDIHVMNSDLYGIESALVTTVNDTEPVAADAPDDRDSRVFLVAGGNLEMVRVSDVATNSYIVSLGVGYFLSPRFSCELSGVYTSTFLQANTEVGVKSKGVGMTLTYHLPMKGGLSFIPQVGVDYQSYRVEDFNADYLIMGVAPLVVEYRADDSMWGFQVGLGELGIAWPVGNTDSDLNLKALKVVGINSASIGFVRYF